MFNLLLLLIFIRPFIASRPFIYLNAIYSSLLLGLLFPWIIVILYKRTSFQRIFFLKNPLIILVIALVISTVFSSNRVTSLVELYKYLIGLFLFIIAALLNDKEKQSAIHTIVITAVIISLFAIYQYFFGFQRLINYIKREGIVDIFVMNYVRNRRVFFPFITPNTLAGYLIMTIPLALSFKKSPWLIIPLAIALILTKSLGAFFSLFLILILYFYLQGRIDKKKVILLSGLFITIGFIFLNRWLSAGEIHFLPAFSTTMRFAYWKDTLNVIKSSALTGVGIGNFNLVQSRFAHNSYLQIWAEMGVLGIISFIWLIFLSLAKSVRNLKTSGSQNHLAAGIIAANAAFLVHNLIDFSFFLPEVALIWWIILGLNTNLITSKD